MLFVPFFFLLGEAFGFVWAPKTLVCGGEDIYGECEALVDLGLSLSKIPSGWLSGESYCRWTGIICNDAFKVTDISVSHLDGKYTSELPLGILSRFSNLESLALVNCSLGGLLPADFGKGLKELYLNENEFTGPLAKILSRSQLKVLHLDGNEFHGLLGPVFAALPNTIEILGFSRNHFYGPLPAASLARFRNLRVLRLGGNDLSGPIPSRELAALPSLQKLSLWGNTNLTGPLAPILSPPLEEIEITATALNGEIDLAHILRNAPKLKRLHAGENTQLQLFSSSSPSLDSMRSLALWGITSKAALEDTAQSVVANFLSEPVLLGAQFDTIIPPTKHDKKSHEKKSYHNRKKYDNEKRVQHKQKLNEAADKRRAKRIATQKNSMARRLSSINSSATALPLPQEEMILTNNNQKEEERHQPNTKSQQQKRSRRYERRRQQQPAPKKITSSKQSKEKENFDDATAAIEENESQIDALTTQMLSRLEEARQRASALKKHVI
uniref:Leucine-rich repeat-containing N-terminal plant-type domain-containing protein n=1 Tax=Aureoumbra lagunensis TaxID=44058 RepID=A0A7S3NQX6_9STRA|mmetsp:Transcript_18026/g.27165  ORF Transcript_18026/g.27165 Transcript_18026/m.27165 type:complete len:498 (+) Transcript_18026:50-1543(+)